MTPELMHIKERIATLDNALEEKLPTIKTLLQEIHGMLKKDADNVTLMSEEDMSTIVRGLKKQTLTDIVTTNLKSAKNTKSLKKLSVSDL